MIQLKIQKLKYKKEVSFHFFKGKNTNFVKRLNFFFIFVGGRGGGGCGFPTQLSSVEIC